MLKKYHLVLLGISFTSAIIFVYELYNVLSQNYPTNFDVRLSNIMPSFWSPWLIGFMSFISDFLGPVSLLSLTLILLALLLFAKKRHDALLLFLSMSGGTLISLLIKIIVHGARPVNAFFDVAGFSMPSSHATIAAIFFSLCIYSWHNHIKNKILRAFFIATCSGLFLIVGFSRLYLNVHWLSDIIAGFALGFFWMSFVLLAFKILKIKLEKLCR